MSDLAIPDPPSEPPEAVEAWCAAARDRIRLAEEEEEEEEKGEEDARAIENIIPPEEDTVYEDWSESDLGDVHSRQPTKHPLEPPLLPIRPLPSTTPSVSSSSSKRRRTGNTPAYPLSDPTPSKQSVLRR